MSGLLGQIEARTKRTGNARHWYGIGRLSDFGFSDAHAEFIANARTDLPRLLAAVRAVEAIADELCEDIPEDAANASMKHAGKVIRRALTEALEGER